MKTIFLHLGSNCQDPIVTTLLGKDKRLIKEKELYYNDKYKQDYMVGPKTSVEPRWIHH
jgi:hypothetical protein